MADDGNGNSCGSSKKLESEGNTKVIAASNMSLHPYVTLAGTKPQGESGVRSRLQGAWADLNADLLAEVFFHLPQKQLFKVMSVRKSWMKAVMEGSSLWKQVETVGSWSMGHQGVDGMEEIEKNEENEGMEEMKEKEERSLSVLTQILRVAEFVKFTNVSAHNRNQMMCVARVLGLNLRSLTLPGRSVSASFFPILCANCPNLEVLCVGGDLDGTRTSVHICHPKLKHLKLGSYHHHHLHIECPSLLDLYFGVDTYDSVDYSSELRVPSLTCPRLTSLHLSDLHSTPGVLGAIAAHAPNISRLKSCVNEENHFSTLSHFKELQALSLYMDGTELPQTDFRKLPKLGRLELEGVGVSVNLVIAHEKLTSLTIKEHEDGTFVVLDCPLLEELMVEAQEFDSSWDETWHLICPRLKRIHLVWEQEQVEPLYFSHDIVEELVLQYLSNDSVVTCENLKMLVMTWTVLSDAHLRFP